MSKLPAKGRVFYSPELAASICDALSDGKLLQQVCSSPGMPAVSTVFSWLKQYPEFADSYSLAKEVQADQIAAQIIAISDTCRFGERTEKKEVGRVCSECRQSVKWQGRWKHFSDGEYWEICPEGKAEAVTEDKVSTADMVDRSRLQVDSRKWLLSKIMPKRYGDRLELAGKVDTNVTVSVAEVMRQRRQKMLEIKEKEDEA